MRNCGRTPGQEIEKICAAILEYLSMLPSFALLFELLPFRLSFLDGLTRIKVICLPMFLRLWINKLCPEYDPHLRAWPRTTGDYIAWEAPRRRRLQRIRKLLSEGRWLDAYEYWWASRRPATRKRLTIPLYNYLGGDKRPFWATIGVFALSGLLHALWYPLIPLYAWLFYYGSAFKVFVSLWLGYCILGIPVALNKKLKNGNKFIAG